MLQYLVLVGAFLSFIACFLYIRAMFRGEARPNRISWLMWALAPMIATAAELSSGVTWAAVPVFMSGFSPLLIFIFSFVAKDAYWKLEPFDYVCGVCSALALILWAITKDAAVAVLFSIMSDGSAAIPTIRKAWTHPETENVFPFVTGFLSACAAFFAIRVWIFSAYAFPIYLVAINIVIIFSVYRKKFARAQLPTKNLIIAVVDNGDAILMRKKPAGSPPYVETWYLFGCDHAAGQDDHTTMKEYLKSAIGIVVDVDKKAIASANETKQDHDGVTKFFTYTNLLCHYVSGIPKIPLGAEKIEWIPKGKLAEYDLVPPSVKLLEGMGYKVE